MKNIIIFHAFSMKVVADLNSAQDNLVSAVVIKSLNNVKLMNAKNEIKQTHILTVR